MSLEITCEDLLRYLSDYIDQNLDEDLTAAAQQHLATCKNCKVILDTTQKTIWLFKEQGKGAIPTTRREKLFGRLEEAFLAQDRPSKQSE